MAAITPEALRQFPLLRYASDETLARLVAVAEKTEFAYGDIVWHAAEEPLKVGLLRRGIIEIVRVTATGAEVTLALFGPRECPGLFAVLDGKKFPADARVLSEVAEIVWLPRDPLLEAIDRDPGLARAMSEVLRHHTGVLREKVDVLTAGEVPQRLAMLFLVLLDRFGDEGPGGELQLPVVLSRRALARLVNARVETVIRVLSKWDKESFVETSDQGFVVRDTDRLHVEAGR
ncbi:MAG: Crp/Fnr family transcriptional regulator [Polyangiaceae bacterium]